VRQFVPGNAGPRLFLQFQELVTATMFPARMGP
jgi:hypothetical protein